MSEARDDHILAKVMGCQDEWTEFANQLLGLTTQDGIQMDSVLEAYITKEGKDPRPDYLGINVIALGWPRSLRLRKAVVRCSLKWCTKLRIKSSLNGVAEQVLSVLTMLEQLQRITNTAIEVFASCELSAFIASTTCNAHKE